MTERPAVVLLPGMDGTGSLFGPLIAALENRWACQTVSYQGHATYASALEHVREQLPRTSSTIVVAESYSGPIAIRLAADPPANLRGIVLACSFLRTPLAGLRRSVASILAPWAMSRVPPEQAVRRFMLGTNADRAAVDAVREAIRSVPPGVMAGRLREVLAVDVRDEASRIALPVLYLQAAADRMVPGRAARDVEDAIPHAQVLSMDGPHLLLQRHPTACSAAIRSFAESVLEA